MSLLVSGVTQRYLPTTTRWQSLLQQRHISSTSHKRDIKTAASASSPKKRILDDFFESDSGETESDEPKFSYHIPDLITDETGLDVQLTKSDDLFRENGIEFVEGFEGLDLNELNEMFVKVRFPRRSALRLRVALENTYYVLWIRYFKPSTRFVRQGQILGFARVISDGIFYASIWDVAVIPAWQRNGLGRGLLERLLVKLTNDGIPVITLYAEPDVVGLYRKLGFKNSKGAVGMAFTVGIS